MGDENRVTYFAATDTRGQRVPFGIKAKDRRRHMYVIGKTGMGKSTLLENMAIQDIRNGEGLAFIDPHGGTADKLLEYVPPERIKDVIYFAPFDMKQPIAFNVMEDVGYDKRHLVVSGLMATFKKIWVDAWSARMEYILSNTLLALLEYPDATLLHVNRMYTDKTFRKKVVDNVKDPIVKDFWTKEFANYGDRYTQEATPAIQNKIGQFTSNPLIRNIIGQPKSSFDIRDCMDSQKILIMNLSKGQVGETNMRLLGSMLTTRIFLGAMSRADLSSADINKLPDFYFYVDEFQNFANETFAEILSEARKYKLNLLIAHQYVEQMDEQVRAAVFGNVGTTISFRVGPFDAETLETVFTPEFTKEDLVNLTFAQVYLSLMIDGVGSRPFSATTIPPIEPPRIIYKNDVIESSRRQFGVPREEIEERIMREIMEAEENSAAAEPKPRSAGTGARQGQAGAQGQRTQRSAERSSGGSGTNSGSNSGGQRPNNATPSGAPRRQYDDSPRPQRSAAPEQKPQTLQDLRAILHSIQQTTVSTTPKQSSGSSENSGQQKNQQTNRDQPQRNSGSLHSTLRDVVKNPPPASQPQSTENQSAQSTSASPFEVPEDVLRALFKDQ